MFYNSTADLVGFTENGPKKMKHPVSGRCEEGKDLVSVLGGQRSVWAHWLTRDKRKETNQVLQNVS